MVGLKMISKNEDSEIEEVDRKRRNHKNTEK